MKLNRFAMYAWSVLAYNVGVILWGAYVRATGSGAGCGQHWPTCNGTVIPWEAGTKTLIEYSHRVSSGLALLMVIGLLVWAYRSYDTQDIVFKGAAASMGLMIMEALLGAGLVLFQLVAENSSPIRALVVSMHLLNTLWLLAAIALTAWWASGGKAFQIRGQGNLGWMLGLGLLGVMLLGATGAVTALGDTLFPSESLAEGVAEDFSAGAHFLVRLRVWHPVLAMIMGLYMVVLSGILSNIRYGLMTQRLAQALFGLFLLQLFVGGINLLLLAPVPLQLIHLLMADSVWITLVLLTASTLANVPQDSEAMEVRVKASEV